MTAPKRPLYKSVSRQNSQFDPYVIRNMQRQLCRINLYALCKVLGYIDVCPEVHAALVDELQKFKGGQDVEISPGVFKYTPFVPLWQLEGERDHLFLYPRSHLKTTIISIAHTIQWIINYPNIRVCISTAIGDQMELIVGSLLSQFRFNEDFRTLFPELCPPAENAADWGKKTEFTIPGRKDITLKEPTVWSCSIGKVNAGFRADVTKHSDLVNEINVKTPGGIKDVIEHFGHFEPIVEKYSARDGFPSSRGWQDVEGTRYDFGDLYGVLIKDKTVTAVVKGAVVEGELSGDVCKCDKMVVPHHKYDHCKTLWPARFPGAELYRILKKPTVGDWIFSSQYLNRCIAQGDGLCEANDIVFIPADVMNQLLPRLRKHVTIDLHGMEAGKMNDFTVMTLAGFDRDGRMYVPEIKIGRFTPEDVILNIFDLYKRHPDIIDFKIEKDAHARVLLPFLRREMSKKQTYPIIYPMKRDTHRTKQDRIRGLRPWFKTHIIVFSQSITIEVKHELIEEVTQFPSQSAGVHDDILDTLADQMQNREGEVTDDVVADPPDMKFALFGRQPPRNKFLGFDEDGISQWLYGPDVDGAKKESKTGFLN